MEFDEWWDIQFEGLTPNMVSSTHAAVLAWDYQQQRIKALEEKCDQQDDALQKIKSWCEAYPLDIFPEPTKEEWQEIHDTLKRELDIPLDRIAASNMRHVINGVAALLPRRGDTKPKIDYGPNEV